MSRRTTPEDLTSTLRLWQQTYSPAGMRDQTTWARDLTTSFMRIEYIDLLRCERTELLGELLRLKGALNVSHGNQGPVEIDLENTWERDASGLVALHAFTETDPELVFRFACRLRDESYITGAVALAWKR